MATTPNQYELTYIITPTISDEQTKDLVRRVAKFIEEHEGEILHSEEWGSRRLAYPINKKRNGYYVNVYFRAPGTIIQRLERALEINDNVLRYLTLRQDAKMIRAYEKRQQQSSTEEAEA